MGDAWDKAKELAEKHANSGGVFVRLANDGDKVIGAFCGAPYAREVLWTGERYDAFDPGNPDHAGKRPSVRVMLNFFVPSENAMKVVEGGASWFEDVLKVRDKYGLDKWLFEIERNGAAGDPKTKYGVLPEQMLDDELRARIQAAGFHDLERMAASEGQAAPAGRKDPAPAAPAGRPAGAPIDPRVAGDLVAKMKALPRADVDTVLGAFGAKRVRDLKASDEQAARRLIDELLAKQQKGAEEEIDPFA